MQVSRQRGIIGALILSAAIISSDAEGADTIDVVLSHLPPPGTAKYAALKRLASATVQSRLRMTHGETWTIPADRLPRFKAAAERKGVTVKPLDAKWNHALRPMDPKTAMTDKQKAMMHDALGQPQTMGMTMMALPPPEVLEHALTKNMKGEKGGSAKLVVQLANNLEISVVRTSINPTKDGYAWHGVVEGTDEPVTLLWWADGRLSGSVTYKSHVYSVRNLGDGMHGIIEVAPNKLPPEHAPMSGDQMRDMGMKRDPLVDQGDASLLREQKSSTENLEDASRGERVAVVSPGAIRGGHFKDAARRNPVVITVLVAYTKAAARFYSDIERDLIALAIEDANQSFRTSGIGNVRLELVHSYETNYVERDSHFNHVFRFADKGDGVMDDVHDLRNRHRADIAVLMVDDPMGCGLAAQVRASEDRAFAVVDQACAATSYSLAHEIGHLIGTRHDPARDDSTQPFSYGHGYVNGTQWRTMMSYKESCNGCPRIPLWSSPSVLIKGVPAGDATSNNARVIAEEAARVAAFR